MKKVRSEVMKKAWKHKYWSGCTLGQAITYAWGHSPKGITKGVKKATPTTELVIKEDFISGMGF